MSRLSPEAILAIKRANPIEVAIGKLGVLAKKPNAKGFIGGQCLCEPVKGKTPLWVNPDKQSWGCLKGGCGHDIFALLEQFEGLDFASALERLHGREVEADPEAVERARKERESAIVERAKRQAALDEAERAKAFAHWQRGLVAPGTLVDHYYRHRGLEPLLSPSLRFAPMQSYYVVPEDEHGLPQVIYRGPAMLAAITRADNKFGGLHITWLDPRLGTAAMPSDASGKAEISSPDGEQLTPKKMRGLKQGGAIRLHSPSGDDRREGLNVFVTGEGIETTSTGLQGLRRLRRDGFNLYAWAAGDLGNLSGGGLGPSSRHPEKQNRLVPSDDPDPDAPGMMPPDWADLVLLLGDGDSDRFVTRARLECARKRYEAAGFPTMICMAGERVDFNDRVRNLETSGASVG